MFAVEEVEEGVRRFVMSRRMLGKDLYRCACYLVGDLLVDTGIFHRRKDFAASLADFRVAAVVNTHAHEDHMGANGLLQERRRIPVYAHEQALPVLADPGKLALLPYQRFFFGEPTPSQGEAIGESIRAGRHAFRVLHTPGHSPDHIALFEKERGWIFSGDAYIGGQDRVFRERYDILGILESLRRLAALDAEVMFTGMGSVIRNPARKIRRKIEYYERISERVGALHRQGIEASEIARRLFPRDFAVRLATSGDFSTAHLIRSMTELDAIPNRPRTSDPRR
ncbi:MAG: MBL fold metallo-hydrolase [Deltaproteobacteria bacterium]